MTAGAFDEILRRYGQTVELHYDGDETGVAVRAFLQPILEQGAGKWKDLPTPLGRARQDRFLYLGDPSAPLEALKETGWVAWRGQEFTVQAAQPVYVGQRLSHWWAVLRPRDEAAA